METRTGVSYNQPRAIPKRTRSKELNDWMRSAYQNGGFPKVDSVLFIFTLFEIIISGSKSNSTEK